MNHLNYMKGTAPGKKPVVYLDCNTVSFLSGQIPAQGCGPHRRGGRGGADVLLSWNFQHVVNEKKMTEIKAIVERAGYRCPLLASPKHPLEDMP